MVAKGRDCGGELQWKGGTVERWEGGGALAKLRDGEEEHCQSWEMAKRRDGEEERWWRGEMVKRRDGEEEL